MGYAHRLFDKIKVNPMKTQLIQVVPARSWKVFKTWHVDTSHKSGSNWDATRKFRTLARNYFNQQGSKLPRLLKRWDRHFEAYGGDPCRTNFSDFRPLRLNREEAWSDWLAHLLQTSQTGYFASEIFPDLAEDGVVLRAQQVIREERTESHRADLIVHWNGTQSTHLEVKLWDANFMKTFNTAREAHKRTPDGHSRVWSDYILIPQASQDMWRECNQRRAASSKIRELTWEQIVVALRKAVLSAKENLRWKIFGYSFCGAIEQTILAFPVAAERRTHMPTNLESVLQRVAILERGLSR